MLPRKWPSAKFPAPWAMPRIWARKLKNASASGSDLTVAPVASQVIQRDRHAQYLSALALITATLEKIALEIRHLQRTEVREAEEPFGGEQRGSSAMPHKRNPVTCEQICGLARVVRSNLLAAFENVALWHERDISHSSVERIILPDSTILADYMLAKMTTIIAEMRVFPERMMRNLESTHGLVFSGQLLQDLVEKGMPRDEAYKAVQENSMAAWETESSFRDRVAADSRVTKYLNADGLAHTFRFATAIAPRQRNLQARVWRASGKNQRRSLNRRMHRPFKKARVAAGTSRKQI